MAEITPTPTPTEKALKNTSKYKKITADALSGLTTPPAADKKYYAVGKGTFYNSKPVELEWWEYGYKLKPIDMFDKNDKSITVKVLPFWPKMYVTKEMIYENVKTQFQTMNRSGYSNAFEYVRKPVNSTELSYNYDFYESVDPATVPVSGETHISDSDIEIAVDHNGGSKRKSRKTKRRRRRAKKTRSNRK